MLHPGEFGFRPGREAVLPARVVGEFVVAPVALVERRVTQDGLGPEVLVGVRAEAVPRGGADGALGAQREAERGEGGQFAGAVLAVQLLTGAGGDGAQEGAGAAGRVEHRAGGPGEFGHQLGELARSERVLARVGVEVPGEQELEGLPRSQVCREFGGAAQQRDRGQQIGGRRLEYGGIPGRAEAWGEDVPERLGEDPGQLLVVGARAQLEPGQGPVVEIQQGAARVHEGGDGALRVAGDLLPDALLQGHLGELALIAQPLLDLAEREGRAGLGATDRFGEVGVPSAPVADGGATHAA